MGNPTIPQSSKSAATKLFRQIENIYRFELTGQSWLPGNESELIGSGAISIERDGNALEIQESGKCRYSHSPAMTKFHNTWIIELLDAQKLLVARARSGSPCHLTDLVLCQAGHWKGSQAYLCGEDSYKGELYLLDRTRIRMDWTVSGPRKIYHLTRIFFSKLPA